MSGTLNIVRGIPGSGKSTYVSENKDRDDVVVSRDAIRFALYDEYFGGSIDEDLITKVEYAAIRAALKEGKTVWSDNTHIRAKDVNSKIKLAYEFNGVEVKIVEIDVPLETAKARNTKRKAQGGRFVPPEVIERMHKAYKPFKYTPMPKFKPYVADTSLPKCLLVDIDGSIALNDGHRGYYDWAKVGGDKPIQHVIDLINGLEHSDIQVIIFSGRDGIAEQPTLDWLKKHGVHYDEFYMREANDMRPDTIVKMEMFDLTIRDRFNCLGVADDRPAVVRQWLKHNINVFHLTPYADDF